MRSDKVASDTEGRSLKVDAQPGLPAPFPRIEQEPQAHDAAVFRTDQTGELAEGVPGPLKSRRAVPGHAVVQRQVGKALQPVRLRHGFLQFPGR